MTVRIPMIHDGEATWYLSEEAVARAQRTSERVQAIAAELKEICEDMGWNGYTLKFENGVDEAIYDMRG